MTGNYSLHLEPEMGGLWISSSYKVLLTDSGTSPVNDVGFQLFG